MSILMKYSFVPLTGVYQLPLSRDHFLSKSDTTHS